MSIVTNTHVSFAQVSQRESVVDAITNIAPKDVPVLKAIGKEKITNTKHEWLVDTLDAPSTTAHIEADETSFDAVAQPTRFSNVCQITKRSLVISDRLNYTDNVGRSKEMVYQLLKKKDAVRRDQEAIILAKTVPAVGDASNAPKMRSLPSWYPATTSVRGAGGSAGSATTAPTDGTKQVLTEDRFQQATIACWAKGGTPNMVVCGPLNKKTIGGFTGQANRMVMTEDKMITATVDIYEDQTGKYTVVADRFGRERDVHILDPKMLKVAYLRPMQVVPLGKTGDAEKAHVLVDWTLIVKAEEAQAIVADVLDGT